MKDVVTTAWPIKPLIELTDKIGSGATPRGGQSAYKTEGISLIRSLNVHDLEFRYKDLARIDDIQADALSNVEVEARDVLLNITGASIARCSQVPTDVLPARVNQHVSIIRPKIEFLDSRFLSYLLVSDDTKNQLLNIGDKAGATRQALTKAQLQSFKIPLPPLEEQKRIVAKLDQAFTALDRARAHAEANLANAGELFDAAVGNIFELLSKNHASEALTDVAEKITKGSSPKWQGISYVDEPGVLFVTSENVTKNAMDFTKTKYVEDAFNEKDKKSILQRDDVLTNIVGASIGRTAVFDRDDIANINQAVCLIRPDPAKLRSSYLAYLLNSPFFKDMLHAGEVNMARANLSLTFFRDFRVPLPSIEDQDAAVSQIQELHQRSLELTNHYQTKLTDIADLRQSLLQKAFSGQL